jgi:hypothetical protein
MTTKPSILGKRTCQNVTMPCLLLLVVRCLLGYSPVLLSKSGLNVGADDKNNYTQVKIIHPCVERWYDARRTGRGSKYLMPALTTPILLTSSSSLRR